MAEAIALDTNLLILVVVGLVDEALIPRCKHTQSFTPDDFTLLVRILLTHKRRIVSASVLAETCNLLETTNSKFDHRLFGCLRAMVQNWDHPSIDNNAVMAMPYFLKFGFADASLAQLAARNDTLILTADVRLYATLSGQEPLPLVENFTHFRFYPENESSQSRESGGLLAAAWREQLRQSNAGIGAFK